jgi:uncharacterized protein with PQ loop repeat
MTTEINNIIQSTVEYKNFGFNALTISAIATIIFSLLQGYGIWKQSQEIWRKESGEAIAATFFFYNFFFFVIFLIYGLEEKSLAITLNGALSFFYLPILLGLKKFKGFTRGEIISAILMLPIIPAIIICPEKNLVLFVFSSISVIVIVKQFKEIMKDRDLGALSTKYIWMFLVTSIFWFIYYVTTKKWLLEIPCAIGTLLYGLVLILDKKFRFEKAKGLSN